MPFNFELFEYNKMMLVYFLTTIIMACWVWKMISEKSLIIKQTPLDIPILLFLGANILSTIFSIDTHVSIWGYYSRSNGGLVSIFSYTLLYFALVSNISREYAMKFLKSAVAGGTVITLYAIPEHFGVSPSCIFLTGQFSANCWVQDVQTRVFATLGQPNWLAAYLAMLIFPVLYFVLTTKNKFSTIFYAFTSILFYLAFTFTYSRGATLGLLAGFAVFLGAFLCVHLGGGKLNLNKSILIILSAFILINLFFGSALTSFKLLSKFAPPPRPGVITKVPPNSGTQLENGGTESGAIRLIVWRGEIDIWRHFPVLGTGVETFAFSYYSFRPPEHNLVSEWDFLYNKAHNEFLNYLANTGLVGFLSYTILILTFIFWSIKKIISPKADNRLLLIAILASLVSYHVQNFFGFSVVIIAVFFYLFPALAFITTDSLRPFKIPSSFYLLSSGFQLIYRRPIYTKLAKIAVIIISTSIIITLTRHYWADTYFASGNSASDAGNSGKAYNKFIEAVSLSPGEPYYRSELAYAAAASAVALSEEDATISARLKTEAIKVTEQVLKESPKNVSFYRTAIRTYYYLSILDKQFTAKTLQTLNQTITLAPTDAKLLYNKAVILGQTGRNQEAIQALEKTVILKPNYRDAYYTLGLFYFDSASDQKSSAHLDDKQKDKAREQMKKVLQLIPGDSEATEKLKEWGQ